MMIAINYFNTHTCAAVPAALLCCVMPIPFSYYLLLIIIIIYIISNVTCVTLMLISRMHSYS